MPSLTKTQLTILCNTNLRLKTVQKIKQNLAYTDFVQIFLHTVLGAN